jgi:hypothetical protein
VSMSDGDVQQLVQAILARPEMSQHMKTTPGTVVAILAGKIVQVHVDGDPPDHTIQVEWPVGNSLFVGGRVVVFFEPPRGAFIITGSAGGGCG